MDKLTVTEARALLAAGEFPAGSMGPKVEACCDFVAAGGERAVIGALDEAVGCGPRPRRHRGGAPAEAGAGQRA